jgi:hypothetical protein
MEPKVIHVSVKHNVCPVYLVCMTRDHPVNHCCQLQQCQTILTDDFNVKAKSTVELEPLQRLSKIAKNFFETYVYSIKHHLKFLLNGCPGSCIHNTDY